MVNNQEQEDRWAEAIAGEIHDGVVQWFVGAKMQAEAIRSQIDSPEPELSERLDSLVHSLKRGIIESRRLMRGLAGPPIEDGRWHEMLRWESSQLVLSLPAQQSKPQLEFELSKATEPLENDLAITLYRLARESIWNSLRHAEPTSVRVFCSNIANAISLQIIDNGRGFNPRSVRGDARGLIGQRQRVERAGGTFQLKTQPGSGTTVTFRIPVFS